MTRPQASDPFRALGVARRADLADDDVRAAWRRVAAATHPDRADGGDPAAFAAAAAAYTVLRTPSGRGEALADLLGAPPGSGIGRARSPARSRPGAVALGLVLASRLRRGRPAVLALRVAAAAAVSAVAVLTTGWQPAAPAIITGAVTWLVLTGRGDLARPPS
jgi:hypothetical protein